MIVVFVVVKVYLLDGSIVGLQLMLLLMLMLSMKVNSNQELSKPEVNIVELSFVLLFYGQAVMILIYGLLNQIKTLLTSKTQHLILVVYLMLMPITKTVIMKNQLKM